MPNFLTLLTLLNGFICLLFLFRSKYIFLVPLLSVKFKVGWLRYLGVFLYASYLKT